MAQTEQWFAWHPVKCEPSAGVDYSDRGGWRWLMWVWRYRSAKIVGFGPGGAWIMRRCWKHYYRPETQEAG